MGYPLALISGAPSHFPTTPRVDTIERLFHFPDIAGEMFAVREAVERLVVNVKIYIAGLITKILNAGQTTKNNANF